MSVASDRQKIERWLQSMPDTESVAGFVPGPGISKLDMTVDIGQLNADLKAILERATFHGDTFKVLPVNHRPGSHDPGATDLSGRYYLRMESGGDEIAMEDLVDEAAYTELDPLFRGTSFEDVFNELKARFTLGRMRVLSKVVYSCNSWHRDPEPRIHIPLVTNPGSLFIVNHHATHLPCDGSVYFTDTRGYHTALNGGFEDRIHIVAAIANS
ncbi:hypothetical protein AB8880_01675 [Alphaproteobacteria bacterium LSUCC0684]